MRSPIRLRSQAQTFARSLVAWVALPIEPCHPAHRRHQCTIDRRLGSLPEPYSPPSGISGDPTLLIFCLIFANMTFGRIVDARRVPRFAVGFCEGDHARIARRD
jgi:hypothetical protein